MDFYHIKIDSIKEIGVGIKKIGRDFASVKKTSVQTEKQEKESITLEEAILSIARKEESEGINQETNTSFSDEFLSFCAECELEKKLSQEDELKAILTHPRYSNYLIFKNGNLFLNPSTFSDASAEQSFSKTEFTTNGNKLNLCYLTKDKEGKLIVSYYAQTKDGNERRSIEGLTVNYITFAVLGNTKWSVTGFTMYRNFDDSKSCYCRRNGKYFPNAFKDTDEPFICQSTRKITKTIETRQGKKISKQTLQGCVHPQPVSDCDLFKDGKCQKLVRTISLVIGELNGSLVIIPCWFDVRGAYGYDFYSSKGEFGARNGNVYCVGEFVETPYVDANGNQSKDKFTYKLEHFIKKDFSVASELASLRAIGETAATMMDCYFPFKIQEQQEVDEKRFDEEV